MESFEVIYWLEYLLVLTCLRVPTLRKYMIRCSLEANHICASVFC